MVAITRLLPVVLAFTSTWAWTYHTCLAANPGLVTCTEKLTTAAETDSEPDFESKIVRVGARPAYRVGARPAYRPGVRPGVRPAAPAPVTEPKPSFGSRFKGLVKGGGTTVGTGILSTAGARLFNKLFPTAAKDPPTSSRFEYASNGYWYSHDVDGLFVSPAGYFKPNAGYDIIIVDTKGGTASSWTSSFPCCLPDGVGTGIDNVNAYYGS